MPADLADAGERDLAQTLLELVGEGDADEEIAPGTAGLFRRRHRRRDEVRGMRGILLPIDVVVIHDPNHQGVEQRSRYRIT